VELTSGHAPPRSALPMLRKMLCDILDRPSPDGPPDLRVNLRRIGALLEDLSRRRVARLSPDRFLEYLRLVGGYAVTNDKHPADGCASGLSRLLFRGFMLAALSVQAGLDPVLARRKVSKHGRLFRLAAHLHGIGPGTASFDFGRAMNVGIRLDDP